METPPATGAPSTKEVVVETHGDPGWRPSATVSIDPSGGYRSPAATVPAGLPAADAPTGGWGGDPAVWPPFLLDLLPQWGRKHLADAAGLPPDVEDPASQAAFLHLAGGSPIGKLRVADAAPCTWDRPGWTDDELFRLDRAAPGVAAEIARAAPGAFGLQGAWPKFMVTRRSDGLWYPDHAVDDSDAADHSIVKWGADGGEVTATILASEAHYVEMARAFGLRCARPLRHSGGVLLIPRFDRMRGGPSGVTKLAQGSIGAASGLVGFGVYGRHETYLAAVRARCADPAGETVEYMLRDIFNQATGNTDNHGRNTSLQRLPDGTVRLSPLYDACPQGLADPAERRATTWDSEDGGRLPTDWGQACAAAAAGTTLREATLRRAVASRAPYLRELPGLAAEIGVRPMALALIREASGRLADTIQELGWH